MGKYLAVSICALLMCGALLGCAASENVADAAAKIDVEYVKAQADDAKLLDVREPTDYAGKLDDAQDRNGHVPGAINIPYANMLDREGQPISTVRLERMFNHANLMPEDHIIVYGAGIDDATAVAGLLESCGYANVDAWTEGYTAWADDPANEVEKSSLSCCGVE